MRPIWSGTVRKPESLESDGERTQKQRKRAPKRKAS
jgi:hypothetical protein